MLSPVKKLPKCRIQVTLKRLATPGMSYNDVISLLDGLNRKSVRDHRYTVEIDADDLILLLKAHAVKTVETAEEELSGGVKTTEGYVPKLVAMWGEEKELGMSEWLEIVPVPGVNFSTVYRYERAVRTGQ